MIGKTGVVGQAFLLANSDLRDGKRERLPYSEPLHASRHARHLRAVKFVGRAFSPSRKPLRAGGLPADLDSTSGGKQECLPYNDGHDIEVVSRARWAPDNQ